MKTCTLMFALTLPLLAVTGCARLPAVTTPYHPAKGTVHIKVVRTVGCDNANHVMVATTAVPSVKNSADASKTYTLDTSKLRGTFSDSTFKLERTPDGRIKSFNASSTGEGEAFVKALSTLAGALVLTALDGGAPTTFPKECALLKDAAGMKPISLTYEDDIETDVAADGQSVQQAGTPQSIAPDASSSYYAGELSPAIGGVTATADTVTRADAPVQFKGPQDNVLHARQPALVAITVEATQTAAFHGKDLELWKGTLPLAQFGTDYTIPLPVPAAFGSVTTGASFDDDGSLTSLQLDTKSGAAQLVGSINDTMSTVEGATAAKAAALKADADVIAQQQRVILCRTAPAQCK